MKLVILLSLAFVVCNAEITIHMKNVTVLQGKDALIGCDYSTDLSGTPTIKWYAIRNGARVLLYTYTEGNREETGPSSNGDRPNGLFVENDGSLRLLASSLQDNVDFRNLECQVELGQSISSGYSNLIVVVLPTADASAKLVQPAFDPGNKVEVGKCESGFGYPTPKITFYRGSDAVQGTISGGNKVVKEEDDFGFGGTEIITVNPNGDGTTKIKDTLFVDLTVKDDMAVFTCVVESGAGAGNTTKRQKANFAPLRVNYPTDVIEFVDPPTHAFAEDELTLTCKGNGYPEPILVIDNAVRNTITIPVTKEMDENVVTCSVQDNSAIQPVEYQMNVFYADDLTIGGDREFSTGDSISLPCVSNSKPQATSVSWMKGDEPASDSANLTISKAAVTNTGVYTCIATNKYDKLSKNDDVTITVKGLVLEKKEEMVDGTIKEPVALKCVVDANPKPTFVWVRKAAGEDAVEEEVTGAVTTELGSYRFQSTVEIAEIDATMSKMQYYCKSTSGQVTMTKTFIFPEYLTAGSPTAGIIIGILVALIIIAVVLVVLYNKGIICDKKGEKGDENAEDIAVKMNKDEESGIPDNNGETQPLEDKDRGEETGLINGND